MNREALARNLSNLGEVRLDPRTITAGLAAIAGIFVAVYQPETAPLAWRFARASAMSAIMYEMYYATQEVLQQYYPPKSNPASARRSLRVSTHIAPFIARQLRSNIK